MKRIILICILILSASVLFSFKAQAQENDTPKTVLVINAVINQDHKGELQGYLAQMMQVFKDNGGKPLGRYKTIEKIFGSHAPEMIAVISFDNALIVKNMLEGDQYKSLAELRERVFRDLKVVLCTELN